MSEVLPEGLVRSNCGPDSNGNCATRDLKLLSKQRAKSEQASKEQASKQAKRAKGKQQEPNKANKSKGASEGSIGIDKRP